MTLRSWRASVHRVVLSPEVQCQAWGQAPQEGCVSSCFQRPLETTEGSCFPKRDFCLPVSISTLENKAWLGGKGVIFALISFFLVLRLRVGAVGRQQLLMLW